MHRLLKLTLLLMSIHLPAFSYTYQGTWWVNGGVGFGDILGDGSPQPGSAFTASGNYATTRNQLATLRVTGVNGNTFTLVKDEGEPKSAVDVGLLYGVMSKSPAFLASITAGLAYTELELVGKGNVTTVGIPVDAQLIWTPSPYVGFGVVGIVNANTEASFGALLLTLQFGALS